MTYTDLMNEWRKTEDGFNLVGWDFSVINDKWDYPDEPWDHPINPSRKVTVEL